MDIDVNAPGFTFYMRYEVSSHILLIHAFSVSLYFIMSSQSNSYVISIVCLHNNLPQTVQLLKQTIC